MNQLNKVAADLYTHSTAHLITWFSIQWRIQADLHFIISSCAAAGAAAVAVAAGDDDAIVDFPLSLFLSFEAELSRWGQTSHAADDGWMGAEQVIVLTLLLHVAMHSIY